MTFFGKHFPSSLRLDLYVFGISGPWRMGSASKLGGKIVMENLTTSNVFLLKPSLRINIYISYTNLIDCIYTKEIYKNKSIMLGSPGPCVMGLMQDILVSNL